MVDANPEYISTVNDGLELNGLHSRVVHGLVGLRDQPVTINISKSPARSSTLKSYATRRRITLTSLDLEELVKQEFPGGIDLLKVDIEGAEKFLVTDWKAVLLASRAVIVEWHCFGLPWQNLQDVFQECGLTLKHPVNPDVSGKTLTALFLRDDKKDAKGSQLCKSDGNL